MNKNTRITAVVGTTMALVIAGTAAVAAAGPRDRDGFGGFGGWEQAGPAMGGMRDGWGDGLMGGWGDDLMGGRGIGLRGLDSDIERTERTVQTADGITTVRAEQGVVDSAAADSLSFSLASGEAITVAIDEDTQVVAFEEQDYTSRRGFSATRMAATEVEPTSIVAGSEVIVFSDAEDDADFVASRIVIKPAADETVADDAAAADTDGDTDADAGAVEDTEAAVTTDA